MIHHGRDIASDLSLTTDVAVIGSGAGGAVAAMRLAQSGAKVVVLEEGGWWPPESFSERESEMLGRLYVGGAMRTTRDFLINVLQGRLVGGSTVINMADNTRIPPEVLAHWAKDHAVEDLTEASLEPHYRWAEQLISSGPILPDEINANNRKLAIAAERLGWRGEVLRHNRVACLGSGYCLLGCRYGVKQSMLLTAIPRAVEAGAEIYSDAEAVALEAEGNRLRRVTAQVLDRDTRRPRGPRITVRADRFVLCAGAIQSPALLMGSGLADRSGPVGANLTLQPQAAVMAFHPDPLDSWRGIPQSYAVTEFEDHSPDWGMGGYRIEAIAGHPGQIAGMVAGFGEAHRERMRRYPHVGGVLVLCPDRPSGRVVLKGGQAVIDYTMTDELRARMKRGMRHAAQALLAAGAEEVVFPFETETRLRTMEEADVLDSRRLEGGRILLISAHPQGTCRMGADPRRAVVDSWGRHHVLSNLWIADASIHPTSASSHTMIPVLALAHRVVERMAADG